MKDLYFIFEPYPKNFVYKSLALLDKIKLICEQNNFNLKIIIFSENKILPEKLFSITKNIIPVIAKDIKNLKSHDYFCTLREIINIKKCYGVFALSTMLSEDYLAQLSIFLQKNYIPNCFKYSIEKDQFKVHHELYDGNITEEYIAGENGLIASFIEMEEGAYPVAVQGETVEYEKQNPIFSLNEIKYVESNSHSYRNREDIRDYERFIFISDKFNYTNLSEREGHVIAKNIVGIRAGDEKACSKKMIGPEGIISFKGRSVKSDLVLNAGESGDSRILNSITKNGIFITINNDFRNLFSKYSDYLVKAEINKFIEILADKIEKYVRY